MNHYAGIDVSLECSSVCVVDGSGKILREAKVASEPAALIGWFGSLGLVVERIGLDRLRNGTFADCARDELDGYVFERVLFEARDEGREGDLIRPLDRFPFVPDDAARLDQDCYEAFNIQVQGLMRRMKATNGERIVIGVSGGLDSTHALLVACRSFDRLGLPRSGILGYTLPGFATSEGTKSNAWALMAWSFSSSLIQPRQASEETTSVGRK